ncbi:hypothetical protein [Candidatus Spongiihabitans sp.]|uniref:hypothetical protein n=1 Tax=Candidatus Spongiihabitans sp. TaxID=3101308 RepID=UPI003C6EC299
MTYEQLLGLEENVELTPENIDTLVRMQANYLPRFPHKEAIYAWMDKAGNILILGTIPPIGCGLLTAQGVMILCSFDKEQYSRILRLNEIERSIDDIIYNMYFDQMRKSKFVFQSIYQFLKEKNHK